LATRGDPADIGIVVAGQCAGPERNACFVAFGSVDEALLMKLYRTAEAVVIPLPSGTGTSVKTIEAMAAGLPVLGTSAAFRGLAVTDGETAVVENDLGRYASQLAALLRDPDRCARIGEAGGRFAEQYDYRRCFQPYRGLLDLP
jgi:glycosyltransferase involved in cell wall biosynthesis